MMTTKQTIDIARQFSPEPIGRYRVDGPHSGETFREDWLIPAFKNHEMVEVVLDGAEGFGSSFLEEAFGGLVRAGYHPKDLIGRLQIISDEDPTLIDEIRTYIVQEGGRSGKY